MRLDHDLISFSKSIPAGLHQDNPVFLSKSDRDVNPDHPRTISSPSTRPTKAEATNHRAQMAFRPVSVTLYVVMVLTMACLNMYTLLAFFRNRDELSGIVEPSIVTEALQVASRSSSYCPMLCMTCVASRLYVLASTHGAEDPPLWVRGCMVAAAVGCVLQFFVVLFLPIITDTSEISGVTKFSQIAGEHFDLHPPLYQHKFLTLAFKTLAWTLQILCILLIYAGAAGIIAGTVLLSNRSMKPISPSVGCVLVLGTLYFSIAFLTWAARTLTGYCQSAVSAAFQQACISASLVTRRAPMVAVLFLVARMRAINLDPPDGMPPKWMQYTFICTSMALIGETLGAIIVGCSGKEETGYYSTKSYQASRAAHICQHSFGLIALVGVGVTFWSIVHQEGSSTGKPAPISPAVKCVLALNALYFFVMAMLTFIAFLKDVVKKSMPMLEDVFNSACISLGFCPNLCILFIAVRLRALQITQQTGSPPGWAQDCMFMCSFAMTLQVICCLVLPMFTGMVKVDADGNPEFDMKPMIGAYMVTFVKFVSLFSLHCGIVVISIAIFVMTPETARPGETAFQDFRAVIRLAFITFLIFLVSLLLSSAKVTGLAVKFAIESMDRALLGVDIHVESATLGLCRGLVLLSGIRVDNPEGFEAPYLMKLEQLSLKLNIGRLICSVGRQFEVTVLKLTGVQVIFEKDFAQYDSKSNVQTIIDHLEAATGLDLHSSDTPSHLSPRSSGSPDTVMRSPRQYITSWKDTYQEFKKNARETLNLVPEVVVYKVFVGDVGAQIYHQGSQVASAAIPEINYPNFYEYCGGEKAGMGQKSGAIIAAIMKILLQSVAKNKTVLAQMAKLSGTILKSRAIAFASTCAKRFSGSCRQTGGTKSPDGRRFLGWHR